MKALRIWLLVLMAVLLPVRGAVAAAMLCAVGTTGMQSELRLLPAGHEALDHTMAHAHGEHQHDHASGAHDHAGEGHAASDHCNMCSAYCSVTPLASAIPTLPRPLDPPSVRFPDIDSPAPTFLSDGQERPPRSI